MNKTHIISSKNNWLEGEAVRQLEQTAKLSGMERVVGMPDLHPGRGTPIGASFISHDIFYPHLVGNDIGCGIGLWMTDIRKRKTKRDRWVKRLSGLEEAWDGDRTELLQKAGLQPSIHDRSLGTIGGGNHFAELQKIEKVHHLEELEKLGMKPDMLYLTVHSGSRGMGQAILREHVDQFQAQGLKANSIEAKSYLQKHDTAMEWAKVNRALIADRFMGAIGGKSEKIIDLFHNSLTPLQHEGKNFWLHRKGAAPADKGPALIPGSRGSWSYLVKPLRWDWECGYSLAHGAGRKWKRTEAKGKLKNRYRAKDLLITPLGSSVICEDKELLYQEAPQAYKNVQVVIEDMIAEKMIEVIAVFRPIITYKTRKRR